MSFSYFGHETGQKVVIAQSGHGRYDNFLQKEYSHLCYVHEEKSPWHGAGQTGACVKVIILVFVFQNRW